VFPGVDSENSTVNEVPIVVKEKGQNGSLYILNCKSNTKEVDSSGKWLEIKTDVLNLRISQNQQLHQWYPCN
jgi:hypothetical protein